MSDNENTTVENTIKNDETRVKRKYTKKPKKDLVVIAENKEDNLTLNEKLKKVIDEIKKEASGTIELEDGSRYTKVSTRVKKLREVFGFDIKIITIVKELTMTFAHVEAQLSVKVNEDWDLIQTSNSFEERHTSLINNTSFVEVAETSAIGRCLGFLGMFGDEFASMEEVLNSINSQKNVNKKTNEKAQKLSNKISKNVDVATEEQKNKINDIIKSNKTIKLEHVLDNQKTSSGKKVTKVEDLTKSGAESIINIMIISQDDTPL
jgi:hypothetical protein